MNTIQYTYTTRHLIAESEQARDMGDLLDGGNPGTSRFIPLYIMLL